MLEREGERERERERRREGDRERDWEISLRSFTLLILDGIFCYMCKKLKDILVIHKKILKKYNQ